MDKLSMSTPNLTSENIEKIADLFPRCIVEAEDELGNKVRKVDFDLLKAELWDQASVEWLDERYRLDWPGKRRAILKANTPITKTLRPVKEDSVDWDTTQNLYIEGDNFEVLKVLQEAYLWKVKCIYVDPPYNTGNDFIYNDDYSESYDEYKRETEESDEWYKMIKNMESNWRFHSDWLSMMYERLKVARDLMANDGVIFLSIDDNEVDNLRKICDEVFWENNFVANLIVTSAPAWTQSSTDFAVQQSYCLVYRKTDSFSTAYITNTKEELEKKYNAWEDEKWRYYIERLWKRWIWWRKEDVPSLHFPVYYNKSTWEILIDKEFNENNMNDNIVKIIPYQTAWVLWRWTRSREKMINERDFLTVEIVAWEYKLHKKVYESSDNWKKPFTIIDSKLWRTELWSLEIKNLFDNNKVFDYPKYSWFVKYLINLQWDKESIILDFFSWSSTTAHATLQLNADDWWNRKFIMVQLPELCDKSSDVYKAWYKNICEIWKERIHRAAKKIKEETNADIDYWFRVYRVDESCMKDVFYHPSEAKQEDLWFFTSNIKEDRTPEDLLTQVILNFGLTLDLPIEEKTIWNSKVFYVAWNSLLACFDDNILDETIEIIAKEQPIKLVFRDSCFKDDSQRINVENKVKRLSPETIIKVI